MASIQKRGKTWRAFVKKHGVRHSATFDTKREARDWAAAKEVELSQVEPRKDALLSEVIDRYIREVVPNHKGARWEHIRLRKSSDRIGHYLLSELEHGTVLADWKAARLKEVQASSVRREMSLLGQVFEMARREWKLLGTNPLDSVKKPPNKQKRTRVISDAEIADLLNELGWSESVAATGKQQVALALLLSLETAMRASEVLQIPGRHRGKVFVLPDTKNGTRREVPLSPRARDLVKFIPPGGFSILPGTLSVLFAKARAACGVPNGQSGGYTFHDARATALTRLSRKLDVLELARMVGHSDPRSLMIYYRRSAADIADGL